MLSYAHSGKDSVALLRKPESEPWQVWTCPMSLRTTEPEVNPIIDNHGPVFGAGGLFKLSPAPAPGRDGQPVAADDELDPDADEAGEVPE